MTDQTAVANSTWLEFLKAPKIGSPSKKLVKIFPAKIDTIQDAQQDNGCLRENWWLPSDLLINC